MTNVHTNVHPEMAAGEIHGLLVLTAWLVGRGYFGGGGGMDYLGGYSTIYIEINMSLEL